MKKIKMGDPKRPWADLEITIDETVEIELGGYEYDNFLTLSRKDAAKLAGEILSEIGPLTATEALMREPVRVTVRDVIRGVEETTLVGVVMALTGGAANPEVVRAQIKTWSKMMGASAQNGRESAADTTDNDRQAPLAETSKPA